MFRNGKSPKRKNTKYIPVIHVHIVPWVSFKYLNKIRCKNFVLRYYCAEMLPNLKTRENGFRSLRRADHSSRGVLPNVYVIVCDQVQQ